LNERVSLTTKSREESGSHGTSQMIGHSIMTFVVTLITSY